MINNSFLYKFASTSSDDGLKIKTFKGLQDAKPIPAILTNQTVQKTSPILPKTKTMEQEANTQPWIRGINRLRKANDVADKLKPIYETSSSSSSTH